MIQNKRINNKPPYLMGLLCLIPLIGAFVGIVIILYGVFKYRDKLFITIGSIGILITAIVYSYLFYNLKFGKKLSKDFVEISQTQLNDLIPSIEFYKLQKGSYPDSLPQLKEINEMVIINDPLLIRKLNKDIKSIFEYRKIGSKYTLYSVGIDGIAKTADDFFPDINKFDSIKIGLLKVP